MNRKHKPHQDRQSEPPCWAERLLTRITAPHIREEVLGDLYELFQKRAQRYGYMKAQLLYVLEMLFLLHPRLWRKQAQSTHLYPAITYSQPNPMDMLSNYSTFELV